MEKNCNRTMIAESAIALLREGISNGNKAMIKEAYSIIENDNFNWDNLDVLFMEWDELVSEGNDILYEDMSGKEFPKVFNPEKALEITKSGREYIARITEEWLSIKWDDLDIRDNTDDIK